MYNIIYFAHSVKDYNSKYEQECIDKISKKFPGFTIINPNTDIDISDKDIAKIKGNHNEFMGMMSKYFFDTISTCAIICPFVDSKTKKYTQGVVKEIEYAKSVDIKVFEITNKTKLFNKRISKIIPSRKDRMAFYKNSSATDFINYYFNVQKGVRYMVGHVENRAELGRMPSYRMYKNNKCKAIKLSTILDEKDNPFREYYSNHAYIYTFKDHKDKWFNIEQKKTMYTENILGMNQVIDLDMPEDPKGEKARRLNFFDHIDEFNVVISKIDKKLTDLEENYNLMFSGNGIYFVLEGYYEDNLSVYIDNIINLIDHFKETEFGDKSEVHVCNNAAPWNDYFKLPFTFHESRPRMSVPLRKGKIDGDWLDKVSDISNVMNDYSIVDDIIEKCRWEKLW